MDINLVLTFSLRNLVTPKGPLNLNPGLLSTRNLFNEPDFTMSEPCMDVGKNHNKYLLILFRPHTSLLPHLPIFLSFYFQSLITGHEPLRVDRIHGIVVTRMSFNGKNVFKRV